MTSVFHAAKIRWAKDENGAIETDATAVTWYSCVNSDRMSIGLAAFLHDIKCECDDTPQIVRIKNLLPE